MAAKTVASVYVPGIGFIQQNSNVNRNNLAHPNWLRSSSSSSSSSSSFSSSSSSSATTSSSCCGNNRATPSMISVRSIDIRFNEDEDDQSVSDFSISDALELLWGSEERGSDHDVQPSRSSKTSSRSVVSCVTGIGIVPGTVAMEADVASIASTTNNTSHPNGAKRRRSSAAISLNRRSSLQQPRLNRRQQAFQQQHSAMMETVREEPSYLSFF